MSFSTFHTPRFSWHQDPTLLASLLLLTGVGFFILYSASHHLAVVYKQAAHIAIAYIVMLLLAQCSPTTYQRFSLFIYVAAVGLLLLVSFMGHIGLGARRWLAIGPLHFQPSELAKLAVPMLLAARFSRVHLPPSYKDIVISIILIGIPAVLTVKQPDLGTAILIIIAGVSTLFLAGLRYRIILICLLLLVIATPLLWHVMHTYQHERILTFLSPERDPLGAGYHIIQSKITIGLGGWFGENNTYVAQAQLHFLPEHTTDFIFSVVIEKFGLIGALGLMLLYLFIIFRMFVMTRNAQDTFTRLLAGSLSLTFFISVFINMGMVCGILPVVGLPLPLVSYGGTSMMMMLANVGILMSIHSHRKLVTT